MSRDLAMWVTLLTLAVLLIVWMMALPVLR